MPDRGARQRLVRIVPGGSHRVAPEKSTGSYRGPEVFLVIPAWMFFVTSIDSGRGVVLPLGMFDVVLFP